MLKMMAVYLQEKSVDWRGIPGWGEVDALSAYLLELNTSVTSLTESQTDRIVELYRKLQEFDKGATKFSKKSKKENLSGLWRTSRKRSGATPGVQTTERYIFTIEQFDAYTINSKLTRKCDIVL